MTNIAITSTCNRSCDYCFAQTVCADESVSSPFMSRAVFVQALDFVDRSGIEQIRLLGGEPTLHPEFLSFLELALARGKPIRIFSNGVMPEATLHFLESLSVDRISFVINLSASLSEPVLHAAVVSALDRMGARAMVGVNISRSRSRLGPPGVADGIEYLLDLIDRYELKRFIRVGLAHPCVGLETVYLHPNQYFAAGRKILELAQRAAHRSIQMNLDCGFLPCVLPELLDSSFGEAAKQLQGQCGPVLDILPDGRVIPCFPLARVLAEKLDDSQTAASLRAEYESRLAGYRELGVWKACSSCNLRQQGACSGGCVAAAMRRLSTPNFQLRI